ncbi:MAG: phosphoesterase, partial [Myxococcales bacterium]|nr:phosphoesterase [Myxococcales bacterium]
EALARFEQFGLGSKLEDRKLLVRERQVLKTAETVIDEVSDTVEVEGSAIPLDVSFLSEESLAGLPARALLEELTPVLGKLGREVRKAIRITEEAAKKAQEAHAGIAARWGGRREIVETAYQKTLRELQKEGVDGSEFIEVTENVEALRPMKSKLEGLIRERDKGVESRRDLLVKWEDAKAAEYRALERAAKKVSQKLKDRVRVTVTFAGDREPLLDLVEKLGGRLSEVRKAFRENADLSIPKLHEAWRDGSDALGRYLKVPKSQTDRLVDGGEDLLFDVEAVDLPPTTSIELNVAAVDNPPVWQTLEELSTGQKATAVLLLTLLESDAPLVVDQPEDDLGSRFIADGVVPRMRDEKQRRQFVFTTHNANIPVLGDAELIAGMEASGEGHQGHATIRAETMGAIDSKPVRTLLEETLEGGKDAFETRRLKYGY